MLHELLAAQRDCVAFWQLRLDGCSEKAARHLVRKLRPVPGVHGVWTSARAELTPEQRWHAATLTAPGRALGGMSAARSWGFADERRRESFVVVSRDGRGTRRRHGDVLVWPQLGAEVVEHRGIPTVVPQRVLADLAPWWDDDELRRAVLEALRVTPMSWDDLAAEVARSPRRGARRRIGALLPHIAGLPIARCRSNAEAQALWRRRLAGRADVAVNVPRGGFEADLVDDERKVITEVDSGFHVDPELDARKDAAWRAAGYAVERRRSGEAYDADASW
jgi:hypothetical protein